MTLNELLDSIESVQKLALLPRISTVIILSIVLIVSLTTLHSKQQFKTCSETRTNKQINDIVHDTETIRLIALILSIFLFFITLLHIMNANMYTVPHLELSDGTIVTFSNTNTTRINSLQKMDTLPTQITDKPVTIPLDSIDINEQGDIVVSHSTPDDDGNIYNERILHITTLSDMNNDNEGIITRDSKFEIHVDDTLTIPTLTYTKHHYDDNIAYLKTVYDYVITVPTQKMADTIENNHHISKYVDIY